MTAIIAKRFHVNGRVQGVFYRASTRQRALQLGVRGYARNLPDGRVEVLAIGTPEALQHLEQWLWQGPPAAQVSAVIMAAVSNDDLHHDRSEFTTQ